METVQWERGRETDRQTERERGDGREWGVCRGGREGVEGRTRKWRQYSGRGGERERQTDRQTDRQRGVGREWGVGRGWREGGRGGEKTVTEIGWTRERRRPAPPLQ